MDQQHRAALRHGAPAVRQPGSERQRIDGVAAEMSPGDLGAVLPGMLEVSYYGNAE